MKFNIEDQVRAMLEQRRTLLSRLSLKLLRLLTRGTGDEHFSNISSVKASVDRLSVQTLEHALLHPP